MSDKVKVSVRIKSDELPTLKKHIDKVLDYEQNGAGYLKVKVECNRFDVHLLKELFGFGNVRACEGSSY